MLAWSLVMQNVSFEDNVCRDQKPVVSVDDIHIRT